MQAQEKGQGAPSALVVQWLRRLASIVGSMDLITGQETKILEATWCSQKKNKKKII